MVGSSTLGPLDRACTTQHAHPTNTITKVPSGATGAGPRRALIGMHRVFAGGGGQVFNVAHYKRHYKENSTLLHSHAHEQTTLLQPPPPPTIGDGPLETVRSLQMWTTCWWRQQSVVAWGPPGWARRYHHLHRGLTGCCPPPHCPPPLTLRSTPQSGALAWAQPAATPQLKKVYRAVHGGIRHMHIAVSSSTSHA